MANNDTTVIGLENTWGLIGNPMAQFNSLGSDVQEIITTISGLAALFFLIITLLSILGHGIGGNTSSLQKDSSGRAHHITGIVYAVVTVLLVLLALGMVFAMYS